jgi:hypothetical protein
MLARIFLNGASETDSCTTPSDSDLNSEVESESEDNLVLEKPEHYLQEAECLDVFLLRQKRYSPRTQAKLETKLELTGTG